MSGASIDGGDGGGGGVRDAVPFESKGFVDERATMVATVENAPTTKPKSVQTGGVATMAIYVVTHIPGRLVSGLPSLYVPIRVGRAAATEDAALSATATADDDAAESASVVDAKSAERKTERTGGTANEKSASATSAEAAVTLGLRPPGLTNVLRDGTSLDHERWSELSSMWRVWRDGPRTATVGFCHYRCFLNATRAGHAWHGRDVRAPPGEFARTAPELTNDSAAELWRSVDDTHIVTKRAEPLGMSVVEHYARCHVALDYLVTLSLVVQHHPELAPAMLAQPERRTLYTRNVFVMSWRNFDALCAFLFGVLTRFCAHVAWPRASPYQSRDVSFLSERLFDAWLRARQAAGCRVTELPSVFVEFPEPGREYGSKGDVSVP